jgi:hypothetical protein
VPWQRQGFLRAQAGVGEDDEQRRVASAAVGEQLCAHALD